MHKIKFKPATITFIFLVVAAILGITLKISGKSYSIPDSVQSNLPASEEAQKIDYLEIAQEEIDSEPIQSALKKGLANRFRYYGNIISQANGFREVALTFDDGPHPMYTEKLIEILEKYDVKATFFVVGKMAAEYPEFVKALYEAGHSIGNHSYSHINLTRVYPDDAAVEIKACGKILYSITGKYCDLFRPPGGGFNGNVGKIADSLGYSTVLWTANSADYSNIDKNAIKRRIYGRIGNGGIILMHDGIQKTIDLLPEIIETLQARGFRFVTVDEIRSGRWASRKARMKTYVKATGTLKAGINRRIISVSEEASLGFDKYAQ